MMESNNSTKSQPEEYVVYNLIIDGSNGVKIAFHVFTISVLVATLCGNTIVISLVLFDKHLRNFFNMLILNLAVSDLLCGLFAALFYSGMIKSIIKESPMGDLEVVACRAVLCASGISSKVSIITIATISVERYVVVKHPLRSRVRRLSVARVVVGIWCLGLVASTPSTIYFTNQHRSHREQRMLSCYQVTSAELPSQVSVAAELAFSFLVPMAVILYTSCQIIKALWCQQAVQGANLVVLRARRHVTKIIISVAVAFDTFYLPWAILMILLLTKRMNILNDLPMAVMYVVTLCSSCANPILYLINSRRFRTRMRRLLCCE